ncbi:MAG TPA: hypothetical protein VLA98_03120, partial [Solirubrobacteraceae bacterium]|nr:hypothetical protein [Solirubrobacteraceae bacterium]
MQHDRRGSASRRRLARRRDADESLLELVGRIGDAYGLVLVLILTTFVVAMTLATTGWAGRVAAIAIGGLTAIIAFTSSDVALGRVRLGTLLAVLAVVAAVVAKVVSAEALL